jgi:DNA-binding MarR family transcriptional regulator
MKKIGEITQGNYFLPPNDADSKNLDIKEDWTTYKYSTVYHGLTKEFELDPSEGVLIATIISLSKTEGYCYMSQVKLAELLGTNHATINTRLQKLESRGLIERVNVISRYKTEKWRITERVKIQLEHIQRKLKTDRKNGYWH